MNDFEKLRKSIGNHGIMVLSTCAGERVTSRPVSVVSVDGKFYFQTDENYLKYKQLAQNENAALSVKNFSIEGKCRDIGKPFDNGNAVYLSAIKKHYPAAYANYSRIKLNGFLNLFPCLSIHGAMSLPSPIWNTGIFPSIHTARNTNTVKAAPHKV